MTPKLQFCLLLLLHTNMAWSAAYKNVTVMEGQTLILRCPTDNVSSNHLEWRNPKGYVMFFNNHKAHRDRRYQIVSFSGSQFTISISNMHFKDGGFYTCLMYSDTVTTEKFKVTVLGQPRLEMTEHEGKMALKCSAQANLPIPQISWLFENGLEVDGHPQYHCDKNKCSLVDILLVRSHHRRTVVKCIVRHQALYSSHLLNFVTIGTDSIDEFSLPPTTTSTITDQSKEPVTDLTTASHFPSNNSLPPNVIVTAEAPTANVTGNISSNIEGNQPDTEKWGTSKKPAPLLIFLVTILILCLLVVLIFFIIKLKKSHTVWKRENEDTDQSLESSKSRSSSDEKHMHERRSNGSVIKPGFHNTNFTPYTSEDNKDKESASNEKSKAQEVHITVEPVTRPQMKETDL